MSASANIITSNIINTMDRDQWERNQAYNDETLAPLFQILEQVKDPEIPALSIWDMGILRNVEVHESGAVVVVITPTYSGCPAMDLIHEDINQVLTIAGYEQVSVKTQLSPAWTTTWMSDDARERMAKSGIAAPEPGACTSVTPKCPVCASRETQLISEFSSTACKALYRCNDCLEPFDYFKNF